MSKSSSAAEEAVCERASVWVAGLFRMMRTWPAEETDALRRRLRKQAMKAMGGLVRAVQWPTREKRVCLRAARVELIDAQVWMRVATQLGYAQTRTATRLLAELTQLQVAVDATLQARERGLRPPSVREAKRSALLPYPLNQL